MRYLLSSITLASTLVGCGAFGTADGEGGSGSGASSDGGDGGSVDGDIPDSEYCDPVASWPQAAISLEDQVLAIVNDNRSRGANCGSKGSFGPAGPLSSNGALRCAARVHSLDMAERGFFDHTNPDGEDPFDRMERAGYSFRAAGENIAAGSRTADQVVNDQWMTSDGHCANIMSPDFRELGVGYAEGDGQFGTYWTQAFGSR